MANMTAKHGNAKHQCSCCDRSGRARRSGRRGVKQAERRATAREARDAMADRRVR